MTCVIADGSKLQAVPSPSIRRSATRRCVRISASEPGASGVVERLRPFVVREDRDAPMPMPNEPLGNRRRTLDRDLGPVDYHDPDAHLGGRYEVLLRASCRIMPRW